MKEHQKPNFRNYFDLYKGYKTLYSRCESVTAPAIETLIFSGKLVAQKRLFDHDEMLIPTSRIRPGQVLDWGDPEDSSIWETGA